MTSMIHNNKQQKWIEDIEKILQCIEIGDIPIPVFFMHLSGLVMESFSIPAYRARSLGVAVTLLKMGLDTHDRVAVDEKAFKKNQDDVLTGGYLSSHFYSVLAEQGEIEAIRFLAKATCQLTECKADHYAWQQQGLPFDVPSLQRFGHQLSLLPLALVEFLYHDVRMKEDVYGWKKIIPGMMLLHELQFYNDFRSVWDPVVVQWVKEVADECRKAVESSCFKTELSLLLNEMVFPASVTKGVLQKVD